ncbi:MAG TPA: hypothetical protein VF109_01220 [Mycobacteriales bacterium]
MDGPPRAVALQEPSGPARTPAAGMRRALAATARTAGWMLAVLACGLWAARLGWHSGSANPAVPIGRAQLIATTALLVVLPWLLRPRRLLGPVGDSRAARVVRLGAYAVLCALLPGIVAVGNYGGARFETCTGCTPAEQAQWHSERVADSVTGLVVILGLVTAYAVAILWLTSRRSPATPVTLALGGTAAAAGGLAVFGLLPVGGPAPAPVILQALAVLAALVVIPGVPAGAGYLAFRRTRQSGGTEREGRSQGATAGLVAGTVGVLLTTVLTLPTMALFPNAVPLKWANPDPAAPHGTTYERQMSVSDSAGNYVAFLLLGPLVGVGMGIVGAGLAQDAATKAATLAARSA